MSWSEREISCSSFLETLFGLDFINTATYWMMKYLGLPKDFSEKES
jgi:hypothetical protein